MLGSKEQAERTWSILTPNADRGQLAAASTTRAEQSLNCTTQIQTPLVDLGVGQPLVFVRKLDGIGRDSRANPSRADPLPSPCH
jgi:hypothetical protein